MPEKMLPSEQEVHDLLLKLEDMRFDRIGSISYMKQIERLGLEPPRVQEKKELSFSYFKNNYEVVIHTTIGMDDSLPAKSDAAWVLIRKSDEVVFYSPRLHRTEYFLTTILSWAEIAQKLVQHRPLCPECKAFMHLTEVSAYRNYRWLCEKQSRHEKFLTHSQDLMKDIFEELSSSAQKYWKTYQSKFLSYTKKLKNEGKEIGSARKKRKKWNIDNPENLE